MAAKGKSINLYLMDGKPDGRIKCTLANWTGIAYKIPRTMLDECKNRDDLKQSGVYFLFGISDVTGEPVVYVGQAGARKNGEGILNRLQEHKRNPDKDYWTEAVVFTTANNSFGPTEISYLENRFCNIATEAKKYTVKNGNDPSQGHITEEKECELEEFVDYAKVIMGVLGHKVFMPIEASVPTSPDAPAVNEELSFFIHNSKADASGKRTADGFVVFKGSKVAPSPTKSCPDTILHLREKYADKIDEAHTLTDDLLFSSPSASAGFVIYASANGMTMWVTSEGRTLKAIESAGE